MSLRSPLSRVTGLGSAKDGTAHWWAERVSSVALLPLTLWLLFSLLTLPSLDYATVRAWMSFPLTGFLSVLLVAVAAYHSYLGTSVVVEDYVHAQGTKLFCMLSLKFAHVLAGGAGIFAILRSSFGA
ncbi:MAG TPA: succinate dehydrogenase, hydrophobic membrane anchor protein [Steroidobacteraceae bacterium]|jgi:succinate dehydrogenase / fumarate reductase membrane anchor subunit|nr:succinate dehydrogenase, hydrophobic membrane anchor protein [Steroidobacteraceae bacterium]